MTQASGQVLARCESCDKTYRVLERGRTYSCKACGGTVRPLDEGEAASAVRRDASEALKSAYRTIGAVTWLYRLGALAYAVATLLAVLALARTDVPPGGGVLVVVLTTLLTVLMLLATMHVVFQPFVWTLAIATLATVVSAVHLLGPNPYGLAVFGSAAWAVVAWATLVPTLRYQRLIATHKDLYVLHHASVGTRRSLKGRTAEARHERLVAAMRRAARRAWKISAAAAVAFVLASALGTYTVLTTKRPQVLSVATAGFEAAWSSSDLEGVGRWFDAGIRAQETARLQGRVDGLGWRDGLPALERGASRNDGDSARLEYEASGVPLVARWVRSGLEWVLVEVELPVPPFEPTYERFLEAWRASDVEGIVAFFSPDSREGMLASIEASVRERGWDSLPQLLTTQMSDYSEGDAEVVHELERSKVRTRWHLGTDGKWRLYALRFPPR